MFGFLIPAPSIVGDTARPARALFAAILWQVVVDLGGDDAHAARRALQWVAACDPWFVFYCAAANVDPRRLRAILLCRFARRTERLIARHLATRKPRGRPRKHPRKEDHAFRASTNRLGP